MIPERLLPLTLVKVRPAQSVDRYGNTNLDYGAAAVRTTFKGWIDQTERSEETPDSRNTIIGVWKLITNLADLDAVDHVEWDGVAYERDGPAWTVHTPAGIHHYEVKIRRVEG